MRLFKLAHIDVVTLNVFSWASLQPSENTYDFSKLDKIMALVKENGLKVCMATSTAAHPAWMARKNPDILRIGYNGIKRKFGDRHISNEYGGVCYCENCEKAFRIWLKDKYKTLEELNRVWNMSFWGHTLYDWDDVVAPNLQSEMEAWI